MAVLLIDKILPKNDAFVGLVDADQVIGLSGAIASGCPPASGVTEADLLSVSGSLSSDITASIVTSSGIAASLDSDLYTLVSGDIATSIITSSGIAASLDSDLYTLVSGDINAASGTLSTYTDTEITALSGTLVTYTDDSITTVSGYLQGQITDYEPLITSTSGSLSAEINSASGTLITYTDTEIAALSGTLDNTIYNASGVIIDYVDNISGVIVAQIGTPAGVVLTDGSAPLVADWDAAKLIQASGIRATDAGGLSLYEDTGLGIFVEDASANVGINDNNPGSKLSVSSAANSETVLSVKGTGTADLVNIFDNTTEVFTILDGGNVGIGTTAPSRKLSVKDITNNCFINIKSANTDKVGILFGDTDNDAIGSIQYYNVGNNMEFNVNSAARMTIDSAGKVGIGLTSPAAMLDVYNASTEAIAKFKSGDDTAYITVEDDTTVAYINARNSVMALGHYAGLDTRNLTINSVGKVGIGTTTPDQLLHISHVNTSAALRFENRDTTIAKEEAYGTIEFEGNDITAGAAGVRAKIVGSASASSGPNGAGAIRLFVADSSSTTLYETFRTESLGAGSRRTMIGDIVGCNYSKISDDGTKTMHGTARVTKYEWISASAVRSAGTKSASIGVNDNGYIIMEFKNGAENEIQFNIKVPDDCDRSEDVKICVGWSSPTADPGDDTKQAEWVLTHLETEVGESTDSAGTAETAVQASSSTTVNGMVLTIVGTFSVSTDDLCTHCKLERDGNDANDTLGDVVELHGVAFQYIANSLGE